ncbi:MAG: hypothetical protein PPP58_12575 [Natronomonas sp.]
MRGQANVLGLAVALLLLTTVTGIAVVVADGAFVDADRDATERATASGVADRLVAADSPLTDRRNVIRAERMDRIDDVVPPDIDARVTVGTEVVYERGAPTDGTTVERVMLLSTSETAVATPQNGSTTVPRPAETAVVRIDPDATVDTVRARDRIVLHDPSGITERNQIPLFGQEPTEVEFAGAFDDEAVSVTYRTEETEPKRLSVTVDV